MPPFSGALNYAYHLDAAKLAALLHRHAVQRLGVQHLADEVVDVERQEDRIVAVVTKSGGRIEADLFIDCSGHRALLIGQQLRQQLDRRVAHAVQRSRARRRRCRWRPVRRSRRKRSARRIPAGWIWDIGLPTRRGIGCVYSSRFMTDEEAEDVLRGYVRERLGDDEGSRPFATPASLPDRLPRALLGRQLRCHRPVGGLRRTARGIGDRDDRIVACARSPTISRQARICFRFMRGGSMSCSGRAGSGSSTSSSFTMC